MNVEVIGWMGSVGQGRWKGQACREQVGCCYSISLCTDGHCMACGRLPFFQQCAQGQREKFGLVRGGLRDCLAQAGL